MAWYVVLLPAALTALVIRLDALWIGPYWSFMELVPGMGGIDVDFWYERTSLRWAVGRRYVYVALLGAGLTALIDGATSLDAALLGTVTAGLLLWPLLFHGLPHGVAPSDWQLLPLYAGVVASFSAASAVGSLMVDYVREQSNGDVVGWFQDQLFEALFWPALLFAAGSIFIGSYKSLRERKRARDEAGYE